MLKSQQQELYERGEVAEAAVYADVDDIFRERPFDIPFYTALNDRACILICFSRSFLSESVIQEVLNSGRPWVLYVRAFLDASYPLVRFNLVFPDNPANPLVLESPIDIKDGNFQDFCAAILTNEQIEIYLRHENGFAGCATFYAQGLSPIILKQVTLAVKALEPGATDADFDSSVTTMESVFPSPSAGLDAARFIWLAPCGAEHG